MPEEDVEGEIEETEEAMEEVEEETTEEPEEKETEEMETPPETLGDFTAEEEENEEKPFDESFGAPIVPATAPAPTGTVPAPVTAEGGVASAPVQTSLAPEAVSFKKILIGKYAESLGKAYKKIEQVRAEKEREIASFIRQNEQLQLLLKDLWTKSHHFGIVGYFSTIELFDECYGILEEQSQILSKKKSMTTNPYDEMLDVHHQILKELIKAKGMLEKMMYDSWADKTELRVAREKFLDTYNEYLPDMKRFIKHTLSGSIIMTERWRGREESTGKPRGF